MHSFSQVGLKAAKFHLMFFLIVTGRNVIKKMFIWVSLNRNCEERSPRQYKCNRWCSDNRMSLDQWQAWIEKHNEVQTDLNVTQKKLEMRARQHTYGCIKWVWESWKWVRHLMSLGEETEQVGKRYYVCINTPSLSRRGQVWSSTRGQGAWRSWTDVAPGICRSYLLSLRLATPRVGITQGITDIFTLHIQLLLVFL